MGVATQVTDLSDLRADLLTMMREATGVTATNNIADRYLNRALHDMHINPGNNWPWAIRRADLITHDDYTTGTVAIALATRTTVTGTSTAWNTLVTGMATGFNNARAGGKMTFAGGTDPYEVSVVNSDTSITLSTRYVESAALAAGSSYRYFEDEYALAADFFRPLDALNFDVDGEISLISPMEFRRRYTRNTIPGKPRVATLIELDFGANTTPRYRVVFHPPPNDQYLIRYDYVTSYLAVSNAGADQTQLTATDDEPIVPLRYRHALVFHAAYMWLLARKDDKRSQEMKREYTELMTRIAGDGFPSKERPRLAPRTGQYYSQTRPYRRQRFDVGGRFDELRDL